MSNEIEKLKEELEQSKAVFSQASVELSKAYMERDSLAARMEQLVEAASHLRNDWILIQGDGYLGDNEIEQRLKSVLDALTVPHPEAECKECGGWRVTPLGNPCQACSGTGRASKEG